MGDQLGASGPHRSDAATLLIATGLAAWLGATAASNLPLRHFDRLRRPERTGPLIPNWRFFAPSPIGSDYELVYRTRGEGVVVPGWRVALAPTPRRGLDAVWMPVRRRDKALMDVSTELLRAAPTGGEAGRTRASALLTAAAVAAAGADGCRHGRPREVQFALLKHDGYAGGPRRLCHLSDFVPLPR